MNLLYLLRKKIFFFFNDLHIGFYKQKKISYRKAACSDTIIFDKEESYK